MTRKEAERKLEKALGKPFFIFENYGARLSDEGIFAIQLIDALEALGLITLEDADDPPNPR